MGAAPTKMYVEEEDDGDIVKTMAAARTKMHVEEEDHGDIQPPPAFDYFELNAHEDARCTRLTQEIKEQIAASKTRDPEMERLRSIFNIGDKAMAAAPTKMHVEEDDDGDMQPPPAFDYFELNAHEYARCTRSTQEIKEQTAANKTRAIVRMHRAAYKVLETAARNNSGSSKDHHRAVLGVAATAHEDDIRPRYEELCTLFSYGGASRDVARALELVNEAFAALLEIKWLEEVEEEA
jgi:hypothetical protein